MPVGNSTNESSIYTIRPPAPPPDPIISNPGVALAAITVSVLVVAGGLLLEMSELALLGIVLTLASLAYLYVQYLQAKGAAAKCGGTGPFSLPAGKINLCPALFAPNSFVEFSVTTANGEVKFEHGPINLEQPMVWLRYVDSRTGESGINGTAYMVQVDTIV